MALKIFAWGFFFQLFPSEYCPCGVCTSPPTSSWPHSPDLTLATLSHLRERKYQPRTDLDAGATNVWRNIKPQCHTGARHLPLLLTTMSAQRNAPILDFPYELTSKIFVHCLPSHHRIRPDSRRAPLLLTRICQSWRTVALSTAELWNSIHLHIPLSDGILSSAQISERRAAMADLWISRSGLLPLSITLSSHQDAPSFPVELLSLFTDHAPRWERVDLQVNLASAGQLCGIKDSFPRLRSLTFHTQLNRNRRIGDIELLRSAPNLVIIDIPWLTTWSSNLHPTWPFNVGQPTWSFSELGALSASLTTLRVGQVGNQWLDCLDLLQSLPNLLHFGTTSPWTYNEADNAPRYVLPALRTLLLEGLPDLLSVPYFLAFPLHHLAIVISLPDTQSSLLASFLFQSSSRLSSLTISLSGWDLSALRMCLSAALTLCTLELIVRRVQNQTALDGQLKYLFKHDKAGILPSLERFILIDKRKVGLYDAFRTATQEFHIQRHKRAQLVGNWKFRAELHHVWSVEGLTPIPPPSSAILEALDVFRRAGMRIRIYTPTFLWPRDFENDHDMPYTPHSLSRIPFPPL